MTTRDRFVLVGVLSAALAGAASAQEEEAAPPTESEAATPQTPGGSAAPAGSAATVTMGMGPFTKESYPQSYVDRPLTLVAGMVEGRAGISYAKVTFTDPTTGMTTSSDATGLGVEVGYGITDQIEAGLSTGLGIDPDFEWSKNLGLYAMYLALDQDKLDVAARVDVPLFFDDCDGCDTFTGFVLGAPVRYMAMDKLALYVGHGLIPIQTADPSAVDLDLNIGVAYQVMPQLAVRLDTQPLSLAISGDGNETTTYGDVIPVSLMGLYAVSNKIDAVLTLSFASLEDVADVYAIGLGANVRL